MDYTENTTLKEIIPSGPYCYDCKKICPFWRSHWIMVQGFNGPIKTPIGECSLLNISDLDSGVCALWDQVKECNINDDMEEKNANSDSE